MGHKAGAGQEKEQLSGEQMKSIRPASSHRMDRANKISWADRQTDTTIKTFSSYYLLPSA